MEAAVCILTDEYNWQSLPRSTHRVQLCVLAGLSISAIYRLIVAAKKIVGHFNHSVVASNARYHKNLWTIYHQPNILILLNITIVFV